MRKRTSKLTLHRETLRALEPARLRNAAGGDENPDQQVVDPGGGGGSIWSGPYVCPYPTFTWNSNVISGCMLCG